jgi:hypothetical protein
MAIEKIKILVVVLELPAHLPKKWVKWAKLAVLLEYGFFKK